MAAQDFSVRATFAAGEELQLQLVDLNHFHSDEQLLQWRTWLRTSMCYRKTKPAPPWLFSLRAASAPPSRPRAVEPSAGTTPRRAADAAAVTSHRAHRGAAGGSSVGHGPGFSEAPQARPPRTGEPRQRGCSRVRRRKSVGSGLLLLRLPAKMEDGGCCGHRQHGG